MLSFLQNELGVFQTFQGHTVSSCLRLILADYTLDNFEKYIYVLVVCLWTCFLLFLFSFFNILSFTRKESREDKFRHIYMSLQQRLYFLFLPHRPFVWYVFSYFHILLRDFFMQPENMCYPDKDSLPTALSKLQYSKSFCVFFSQTFNHSQLRSISIILVCFLILLCSNFTNSSCDHVPVIRNFKKNGRLP